MFTERLAELMSENRITKAKLAADTGIPLQTICNWLSRGSQPSADRVAKLADYFEVSTDYLLGRSNELGIIETDANLSKEEEELLLLFRKMDDKFKYQVLGFAKGMIK